MFVPDDIIEDVKKIVDYCYEEEAHHYEESDDDGKTDHIFLSLEKVSKFLY